MQIMIKVSDVSNEARPMDVSEPWLDCLLCEFFMQVYEIKSKDFDCCNIIFKYFHFKRTLNYACAAQVPRKWQQWTAVSLLLEPLPWHLSCTCVVECTFIFILSINIEFQIFCTLLWDFLNFTKCTICTRNLTSSLYSGFYFLHF